MVGQLRSLGVAHSVVLVTQSRALKVLRWRRWASTIGEINNVHVPVMVRVARAANKEHVQQALDTIIDLLEAEDTELVQIDGSVPPGFGVAAEVGQNGVVCGNGTHGQTRFGNVANVVENNVASITHDFMYRLLCKKL